MRFVLIAAMLTIASLATGQKAKLAFHDGFFSQSFTMGEHGASFREVRLHLSTNCQPAYKTFRRADRQRGRSWLWAGGALAGFAMARWGKTDDVSYGGATMLLFCVPATVVANIGYPMKYRRAARQYNEAFRLN